MWSSTTSFVQDTNQCSWKNITLKWYRTKALQILCMTVAEIRIGRFFYSVLFGVSSDSNSHQQKTVRKNVSKLYMKYERNWMHNNCARQGWLTEIIWSFFYAHIVRFCSCCVKWLSTISFFLVFISGSFTQSFIVYFLHLFSCWFLSCPFLRQAQFFSTFSFKYFFGHLWFRWSISKSKRKPPQQQKWYAH